jgi:ParB/RepB/Spo0J family partition protein
MTTRPNRMVDGVPNPRSEDVPYARLLPPKVAARETMDDAKMAELMESMMAVGLLQPLVVEEEGDALRIHAGHRRYTAAGFLKWATVPCRIYRAGTIPGEAAKAHENAFREDLNPAEEAIWFQTLYETECGQDTDKLAALVQRKRGLVEERLLLIQGDRDVFEAVRSGEIRLNVAEELNRIKDVPTRRMYLDVARRSSPSGAEVRRWRIAYEQSVLFVGDMNRGAAVPGHVEPTKYESSMRCFMCGEDTEAHTMIVLWVHGACKRIVLDKWLEQIGALEPDDSSAKQ